MICIIPARGGSKRLPRKNILPFRGKPLVSHVIETSLATKAFDNVIVSTEDQNIAEIAHSAGAHVHERKVDLASDISSVVDVCSDVLDSHYADNFCCIYATSVLLSASTLSNALDIYKKERLSGCSSLMGVSKYNFHPVQALFQREDGFWEMLCKNFKGKRSQEYPDTKVSNGTFYIADTQIFQKEATFYTSNLKTIEVPEHEVCDLDYPNDYDTLLTKE